jgi:hypothetical protein
MDASHPAFSRDTVIALKEYATEPLGPSELSYEFSRPAELDIDDRMERQQEGIDSEESVRKSRQVAGGQKAEHEFRGDTVYMTAAGIEKCADNLRDESMAEFLADAVSAREGLWGTRPTSAQPRLRRLRDNLKAKPKLGNSSYPWVSNRGRSVAR